MKSLPKGLAEMHSNSDLPARIDARALSMRLALLILPRLMLTHAFEVLRRNTLSISSRALALGTVKHMINSNGWIRDYRPA
jgi:hypothetical protein